MIKVITFDLDDTLWAIEPVLAGAEKALHQWLGQHCPDLNQRFSVQSLHALRMELIKSRPALAHQISLARIESLQLAMQESGYPASEATTLARQAFEVFLDARHEVCLFDQVEELIASLHQRYILGVLTNGNADIYRLPLGRYFSFSYSAEALNSSKPASPHFERTLEKTAASPQQIIHVGDHIDHDIQGAQQHGWHTIWINPQNQQAPGNTTPTETVGSISEVPSAIERIEQAAISGAY